MVLLQTPELRTAGTESSMIARLSLPSVKSCELPVIDSLMSLKMDLFVESITIYFVQIELEKIKIIFTGKYLA